MSEKYGFVYIWLDRKKRRFYVGSHWGTEIDGYVCSSAWMLQAYNVRPQDFKRRTIKRIYTNRLDLLNEENRLLGMIKQEELGRRYYNKYVNRNHWCTVPNRQLSVAEKVSRANKGRKHKLTPEQLAERGKKISESKAKKRAEREALGLPVRKPNSTPPRKGHKRSEEAKRKTSESLKRKWAEGSYTGTTGHTFEWSEERRQKQSEACKGVPKSEEAKKNIGCAAKRAWAEGKFSNRKPRNGAMGWY